VHLSPYHDETSELCHWHIPQAHDLESWSDARAFDGTASIVQPLIAPFYAGKTAHELLSALLDRAVGSPMELVRATWKELRGEGDRDWQIALHNGVVPDSHYTSVNASAELSAEAIEAIAALAQAPPSGASDAGEVELTFRPDPSVWDGRFANNGWLQELPKPLSKLTWDNAVLVSPAMAQRMQLRNGDGVTISHGQRSVEAPVWILPGQPDGSVTVHLGYGRWRAGRVGDQAGFNAYLLRTTEHPWIVPRVRLTRTSRRFDLAATQLHHQIDGRNIIRTQSLEEYRRQSVHNRAAEHGVGEHEMAHEASLYPEYEYRGHAWGMTIDLTRCTGCNACVAACQAENNIPIVGKEGVQRGREMHWLRIDSYHLGSPSDPQVVHQPMLCQHCEKAPCEVVCPVAATTHSSEGLNEMTYNRCVGTRYCSNNCPYKVRRFNFLDYSDSENPLRLLLANPDVTVRSRGVMEKCTYCVQRINAARIEAKKEQVDGGSGRIPDGGVVTACQAACPAQAIVFGDTNDPQSRVAALKSDRRNYGVLSELGTQPRTTYLTRIRNPNPALE
jgi:molybdopterin-containing oxidoreductase family iron-sulfur binding subunit